jgi:hypothetical protein
LISGSAELGRDRIANFGADQEHSQVITRRTEQLLPILDQVLGSPDEQLSEIIRSGLVELVKYLHGSGPAVIDRYDVLKSVARG